MFADYHLHTYYSSDSVYPMEDVVKDAILLGIDELCFTDHCDLTIRLPGYAKASETKPSFKKYFREINQMQKRYGEQITIKKGLEIGIQYETIPQYQEIIREYPMDFVLLSIHRIDNLGYWNRRFQEGKSEAEYYHAYYEAMLKIVKEFHDYSVLAHLDLIRRYDNHDGYDVMNDREIITEILKYIIADGKGIEVNMSCIRYDIGDITPAKSILELYHELGGRILTIGSDSHKPIHLGAYVEEVKEELRSIGFKEFCTFENMKPIFHKL